MEKVVLNMGVGEMIGDIKIINLVVGVMEMIVG